MCIYIYIHVYIVPGSEVRAAQVGAKDDKGVGSFRKELCFNNTKSRSFLLSPLFPPMARSS